jgi:hypothetical protein
MIQKDLNKLKELSKIKLEGSARNSQWIFTIGIADYLRAYC